MAAAPSTPTKPSSAPGIIQSTPHSRTSANATTMDTAPVASLQSELKKTMADEFGGHIWEFPPEMLAQMLSPKRLKPAYFEGLIARGHQGPLHPTLDDHICLVNDAAVASALNGIEAPSFTSQSVAREAQTYETLCQFLNGCIRTIDSAYDHLAHRILSMIFALGVLISTDASQEFLQFPIARNSPAFGFNPGC
ncbi:hypothetical protein B0H14DRAFT_3779573 [Mycena olivaceomarginata]|nr:hypothetical protein B0H14DRAFT_3779573 [Mycena olivaceomarginata]